MNHLPLYTIFLLFISYASNVFAVEPFSIVSFYQKHAAAYPEIVDDASPYNDDWTRCVQDAITMLSASEEVVLFFPEGIYRITGTIYTHPAAASAVSVRKVTLSGHSDIKSDGIDLNSGSWLYKPTSGVCLAVNADEEQRMVFDHASITIRHLHFFADSSAAVTAIKGFRVRGACISHCSFYSLYDGINFFDTPAASRLANYSDSLQIHHLYMEQIQGRACEVKGADHSTFSHIMIRFRPSITNRGIVLANSCDTKLQTIRITHCGADSAGALFFNRCSRLQLRDITLDTVAGAGYTIVNSSDILIDSSVCRNQTKNSFHLAESYRLRIANHTGSGTVSPNVDYIMEYDSLANPELVEENVVFFGHGNQPRHARKNKIITSHQSDSLITKE